MHSLCHLNNRSFTCIVFLFDSYFMLLPHHSCYLQTFILCKLFPFFMILLIYFATSIKHNLFILFCVPLQFVYVFVYHILAILYASRPSVEIPC